VHCDPLRVFRSDSDGETDSTWSVGRKEAEFAEVLAPNSSNGAEDEWSWIFRSGMSGGRDDGIREVVASVLRNTCFDERRTITGIDEGVVYIFRERIEVSGFGKALIVRRASVFSEIVALKEKSDLFLGENFNEVREEGVFCQSGIVDDPEIRLKWDQVPQFASAEIALEAVIKFGDGEVFSAPIDLGSAGGHNDSVSLIGERLHLGLDYARYSSAAQVIVDYENEHLTGGVCLFGTLVSKSLDQNNSCR